MAKRNAPKRRRSRTDAISTAPNPTPTAAESCEQCRLAHRRIRFSISIKEAEQIVGALNNYETNADLRDYFQAHVTIALRRESYEYE